MDEHMSRLFSTWLETIMHKGRYSQHHAKQDLIDYVYEVAAGDERERRTLFELIEFRLKLFFSKPLSE